MGKVFLCGAIALLCSVAACSNRSSSGSGEPAAIDDATRAAALDAVNARFSALHRADGTVDTASLSAYISSRPEFASAGVTSGGLVFGFFKDGRVLAVFTNLKPDPTLQEVAPPIPPGAKNRETTGDVPPLEQMRVVQNLGAGFSNPTSDIVSWTAAKGYSSVPDSMDVEEMKSWSGDGVVFINTHGGKFPFKSQNDLHAALLTATPHTIGGDAKYKADLTPDPTTGVPLLGYGTADFSVDAQGHATSATNYMVFGGWIQKYLHFASDSLVLVQACDGAGTSDLVNGFFAAGAGVYAGWSDTIDTNDGGKATRYAFDRMLGANQYKPESPPQRPFEYPAVKTDMAKKGLDHSKGTADDNGTQTSFNAEFTFQANPRGTVFTLLAPTIRYLSVDEQKNELTLTGLFGTDQDAAQITVGGTQVAIKQWGFDSIVADLPPDLAGDVVITVHDHQSNAVPLTQWVGDVNFTETDNAFTVEIDTHVEFRADLHGHRDDPATDPILGISLFQAEQQVTTNTYAGSGTYCGPGGCGSMQGNGNLSMQFVGVGAPTFSGDGFFFNGTADSQKMMLGVDYQARESNEITIDAAGQSVAFPFYLVPAMFFLPDPPPPDASLTWNLPMDDGFNPGSGQQQVTEGDATLTLQWNFSVQSAPDPSKGEDAQAQ